jgi:hypothetical protein
MSTPTTTAAVATMSTADIMQTLADNEAEQSRLMASTLALTGELDRRRGFEAEGATSIDTWTAERLGLSIATARARSRVAARVWDLPQLSAGLAEGELTFDKLAAVIAIATPDNDADLRRQARHCTVRQLRDHAAAQRPRPATGRDYDARTLRFHDECHSIAIQLPAETYTECRAIIDHATKDIASDGTTPLDQRRCDAFLRLLRGRPSSTRTATGGHTVVVHAPLSAILSDTADPADAALTEIGGELERHGLLDRATVQRIACDATIVLALDDDVGHTMYEGRAKRFPTPTQQREVIRRDRHCRFPGCTNWTFTNIHHLEEWKSDGGRTDLPNLLLLCEFHHDTIHKKGWRVTGDANTELNFVGPTNRPMSSLPSPQWTRLNR